MAASEDSTNAASTFDRISLYIDTVFVFIRLISHIIYTSPSLSLLLCLSPCDTCSRVCVSLSLSLAVTLLVRPPAGARGSRLARVCFARAPLPLTFPLGGGGGGGGGFSPLCLGLLLLLRLPFESHLVAVCAPHVLKGLGQVEAHVLPLGVGLHGVEGRLAVALGAEGNGAVHTAEHEPARLARRAVAAAAMVLWALPAHARADD
mmetsp:Transcript_10342/g.25408  ORF Transcript_10342/g.25408 Transcript_10342/m.25408 type:complete len:205 (-) Transcript_10342:885-1499(-)